MMLQLSDHAAERAQQRGISRDSINLVSRLAGRRGQSAGQKHPSISCFRKIIPSRAACDQNNGDVR